MALKFSCDQLKVFSDSQPGFDGVVHVIMLKDTMIPKQFLFNELTE